MPAVIAYLAEVVNNLRPEIVIYIPYVDLTTLLRVRAPKKLKCSKKTYITILVHFHFACPAWIANAG